MQTSKFRLIAQIVAALLLLSLALLASAQPKKPSAPPAGAPLLLLPGSPLDLMLAGLGASPPLQYETSVAHTRPELAKQNLSVGPEYLQEGRALDNEGVVQAGRYILPFGTKGEKVGLAFLSGDYRPRRAKNCNLRWHNWRENEQVNSPHREPALNLPSTRSSCLTVGWTTGCKPGFRSAECNCWASIPTPPTRRAFP